MTGVSATSRTTGQRGAAVPLRVVARVMLAAMLLAVTGCAGTDVKATFHPALLPVKLEWGPSGVQVVGETSIVTPIGVFSMSAEHALWAKSSNALYVIFRDSGRSLEGSTVPGIDTVWEVRSGGGQFTAVINGTAVIQVTDQEVLIDVTDGTLKVIEFKSAQAVMQQQTSGIGQRWQTFWDGCVYTPMSLSRWAYDDSTIGSWFGLGFVWFLLRLVLAIILGVVDVLLTIGCFLAAVAFLFLGPTARNITYGVEVLVVLFLGALTWLVFNDV